jgi:REP element-mobilizing transposase RayT
VIQRGVERRTTFVDDADRHDYLRRLDEILPEERVRCLAWVLMSNHVHLLLQTGDRPLAHAMQRLGTGYSLYFNRRHDRVGHLVQNRYRSRPARDDADAMGLIRYVHRNPLRAQLVDSLDQLARYPWCGHGALLGVQPARRFHDAAAARAFFGDTADAARDGLQDWMRDGDIPETLGATLLVTVEGEPWTKFLAWRARVCAAHGVDLRDLTAGSRESAVTKARSVLALTGVDRLGLTAAQVGKAIGATASGVARAVRAARGAHGAQGMQPPR